MPSHSAWTTPPCLKSCTLGRLLDRGAAWSLMREEGVLPANAPPLLAARLQELAVAFHQKAARAGNSISADMRMGSSVPGGSLLGARPLRSEVDLSAIPAEHLFHMMLETCTACHSKYRLGK